MAALAIEPAGLWGLVVLAAVSRRRFVPRASHGFSTKHLFYDLQRDLLEMRLGFLLGAVGLDHGERVPSAGVLRVTSFGTLIFRLACS